MLYGCRLTKCYMRLGAGFRSGAHRLVLPTAKPMPVFRSLGRNFGDGKAAPKRRLSKFGTPDVHCPLPSQVLYSFPKLTPLVQKILTWVNFGDDVITTHTRKRQPPYQFIEQEPHA